MREGEQFESKIKRKNPGISLGSSSDYRNRAADQYISGTHGTGEPGHVCGGRDHAHPGHGIFPVGRGDGHDAHRRGNRRPDIQNSQSIAYPADRFHHGSAYHHIRAGFAGACPAGALCAQPGADSDRGGGRGNLSGPGDYPDQISDRSFQNADHTVSAADCGLLLRAWRVSGGGF